TRRVVPRPLLNTSPNLALQRTWPAAAVFVFAWVCLACRAAELYVRRQAAYRCGPRTREGKPMTDSCDCSKGSIISLGTTRKAIGAIRDFRTKEDLLHFVSGAEVCLEHQEVYLACDCLRTVVTTVVALNRTLTPEVTVGILDGL